MHSFLKSTFKFAVVVSFFALPVNSAQAQSSSNFLPSGNISMTNSGPVATFNTGPVGASLLGGNQNIAPTQNSGFQFNPTSNNSNSAFGGPLGAGGQGFGGGSAASQSQGATGLQSRESARTWGNQYGGVDNTNAQRQWGNTTQETNLLSTGSVNPMPYPSASHDYGFSSGLRGWGGTIMGGLRRGWYLPPTSTSAVDLNIVDP